MHKIQVHGHDTTLPMSLRVRVVVNLPISWDRLILCPKIRGKGGTMATVIVNIRDILGYDFGNFEVPEDNFWDNYEKILFSLGEDMDSTVFDFVKGGE